MHGKMVMTQNGKNLNIQRGAIKTRSSPPWYNMQCTKVKKKPLLCYVTKERNSSIVGFYTIEREED